MKNFFQSFKNTSKKPSKQPDAKKAAFYANINRFPEVKLNNTPTVIISNALQAQISILHSKFGSIEWSGFLLYTIDKGSYEDASNMVITAQEIYPCDVGSSVYTEYDAGDFVIDMDETTDFLMKGWRLGHIHTHHTMDCYFSGTDMSELHSNVGNYKDNFYLSLIVNKTHDVNQYCAKIAKLGTKIQVTPRFKFKGKPFGVSSKKEVEAMHHTDCEIKSQIADGWFKQIENITPVYKPVTYYKPASTSRWSNSTLYNNIPYVEDENDIYNWDDTPFQEDEDSTTREEALECFFTYWVGASLDNKLPVDDFHYYPESVNSFLTCVTEVTKPVARFGSIFSVLVERDIGKFKSWHITELELLKYAKEEFELYEVSIHAKEVKQFIEKINYLIDLKQDLK